MLGRSKPTVAPDLVSEPINLEGPIVLDLGEVRDEPVVIGWHVVTIERAEAGVSHKQNLPKIFILSRVTDEADIEYNRTIIWNIMLAGDGLVFTKRCLSALGLPAQLNYPSYQALGDDLLGREVEVKVKHRVYKGEKQVQISNWKAITPDISF
jgi:hypothetical protein